MKNNKGFTLIELLIVIALLGALAIGLLATIDPLEQLKKGRDTATRTTVEEFYNGNLRYYGAAGEFPWSSASINPSVDLETDSMVTTVQRLISAGELKGNFTSAAGRVRLQRVWINSTATDDIAVCFQPESKNFRYDPNTIFSSNAANATGCLSQGGTDTSCYWCIH